MDSRGTWCPRAGAVVWILGSSPREGTEQDLREDPSSLSLGWLPGEQRTPLLLGDETKRLKPVRFYLGVLGRAGSQPSVLLEAGPAWGAQPYCTLPPRTTAQPVAAGLIKVTVSRGRQGPGNISPSAEKEPCWEELGQESRSVSRWQS